MERRRTFCVQPIEFKTALTRAECVTRLQRAVDTRRRIIDNRRPGDKWAAGQVTATSVRFRKRMSWCESGGCWSSWQYWLVANMGEETDGILVTGWVGMKRSGLRSMFIWWALIFVLGWAGVLSLWGVIPLGRDEPIALAEAVGLTVMCVAATVAATAWLVSRCRARGGDARDLEEFLMRTLEASPTHFTDGR